VIARILKYFKLNSSNGIGSQGSYYSLLVKMSKQTVFSEAFFFMASYLLANKIQCVAKNEMNIWLVTPVDCVMNDEWSIDRSPFAIQNLPLPLYKTPSHIY